MLESVSCTVNGLEMAITASPDVSLLSVLREQLDLTGAKIGCAEGSCGACTVLVDGELTRACVTPLAAVAGRHVLTIEGLARDHQLHPLQRAFLDTVAFQCGYCTPGMIMAATALLTHYPDPDQDTIVRFMQGNICRCGMYARIVGAIRQSAAELRADKAVGGEP
jgi:isoquinoline 1-oxidoreductase subunit alpha